LVLRVRLHPPPHYRWVHGDSHGVPGLVLDRFYDVVVAQIVTAGKERIKPEIMVAVQQVLNLRALLWKNDSGAREMEKLESYVELAFGDLPAEVTVTEGESTFAVELIEGQKTGWFFDQRDNRNRLGGLVRDASVLDVFSYVGAWGIRAAALG